MARKEQSRYSCIECGYVSLVPAGKCPRCGAWGTLEEERPVSASVSRGEGPVRVLSSVEIGTLEPAVRLASGFGELDRVLGGGWVEGGVVLIGGTPGIGKSTLLLQACGASARAGSRVLYISGEESPSQIGLRARRLEVAHDGLEVCCHTVIDEALEKSSGHSLIVVDSVQAMRSSKSDGVPGSPTQVRAVAQTCVDYAKENGVPMVLVGHITKEGRIAGPMLLEHMVDAVIMFSDDTSSAYRILRALKNRYGDCSEVGFFEMGANGLSEVPDPSYLYWNAADLSVPGVAMTVLMEGSRPLVAELQTLACETSFAYPKRASLGISSGKLSMLCAVLQTRCGFSSANADIYCNVAGGLEVKDPGADLALCASLASALGDRSLAPQTCLLGEVGLAGEVRPVSSLAPRLREAARLGFKKAVISSRSDMRDRDADIEVVRAASVAQALACVLSSDN